MKKYLCSHQEPDKEKTLRLYKRSLKLADLHVQTITRAPKSLQTGDLFKIFEPWWTNSLVCLAPGLSVITQGTNTLSSGFLVLYDKTRDLEVILLTIRFTDPLLWPLMMKASASSSNLSLSLSLSETIRLIVASLVSKPHY